MGQDKLDNLKDYEEIYGRPTPIKYDILHFNDEHRRLDALLRRYWDDFHPLIRDLFTSFANEFQYIVSKLEEMEGQVEINNEEKQALISEYEQKVNAIDQLETEKLHEIKEKLDEKEDTITRLSENKGHLQNIIDDLETEIEKKEELILTQREEIDGLVDENTRLNKQQKEKDLTIKNTISNVTNFADQLAALENELEEIQSEKGANKEELQVFQQQIQETEKQYISEIKSISKLYEALKTEAETLMAELVEVKKDRKQIKKELEMIKHENKEVRKSNLELQNKILKQNKEIKSLREKQENFKKLASKLVKIKDYIKPELLKSKTVKQKEQSIKPNKAKRKSSLELELEEDDNGFDQKVEKLKTMEKIEQIEPSTSTVNKIMDKINRIDKDSEDELIGAIKKAKPSETQLDKLINTKFNEDEKIGENQEQPKKEWNSESGIKNSERRVDKIEIQPINDSNNEVIETLTTGKDEKLTPKIEKLLLMLENKEISEDDKSKIERMLDTMDEEEIDILENMATKLPKAPTNSPNKTSKNDTANENKKSKSISTV